MLEIRQLKYFLSIADHGSLSKAAARLYVAQSALSLQLAQLEKELSCRLLHRTSTGVSLTEHGRIFYEHAQAVLRQLADARSAVGQLADSPAGNVVLGIPQSASAALALPLLLAVREHYPRITLQLTEELTGHLTEQLRLGRLNLAILFDDGQLREFAHKRVASERLCLILASNGKHARRRVSLEAALSAPLILPSVQHGVRQRIERLAAENGLGIERLAAEINSINILKSAILAGVGGTILPVAPFRAEIEQRRVVAHDIYRPAITRTLALCASRNIPMTHATRAVSKLVVLVTRALCGRGEWPGAEPIFHDNANLAA